MSNILTPQINSARIDAVQNQPVAPEETLKMRAQNSCQDAEEATTHNSDEHFDPDIELMSIGAELAYADSLYDSGYSADEAQRIAADHYHKLYMNTITQRKKPL